MDFIDPTDLQAIPLFRQVYEETKRAKRIYLDRIQPHFDWLEEVKRAAEQRFGR